MLVMLAVMLLEMVTGIVASDPSAATAVLKQTATSSDLMREPVVLSFCRLLVRKAMSERDAEQAAFVVRTTEGALYFVWWPSNGERDSVRWSGSFPEGTIAIVHTHPLRMPLPSNLDMSTARRARIPVYVITMLEISRTTGGPPEVVIKGQWMAP